MTVLPNFVRVSRREPVSVIQPIIMYPIEKQMSKF